MKSKVGIPEECEVVPRSDKSKQRSIVNLSETTDLWHNIVNASKSIWVYMILRKLLVAFLILNLTSCINSNLNEEDMIVTEVPITNVTSKKLSILREENQAHNLPSSLSSSPKATIANHQGYFKSAGAKIYYQTFGNARSPIIILHGGPGLDQSYLLPQMSELARNYRVTFYDQGGSGKSLQTKLNPKVINVKQFIVDLEALRKHLGYNKLTLIGHSWGGLLAMNYAIKYPDNLSSLVLLNSSPASSHGFKEFMANYIKQTAKISKRLEKISATPEFKNATSTSIRKYLELLFSVYCYNSKDSKKLSLNFMPNSTRSGFKVTDIFMQTYFKNPYDLRPELKKLKTPTLIIHGDHDIVPVKLAKELNNSIPNSKLVIIENCGHFPYIEQPQEFFENLSKFLNQYLGSVKKNCVHQKVVNI